ncbi:MAG: hypothetical protein WBF58_14325, partial [Xanthobacteraceae bacterium]
MHFKARVAAERAVGIDAHRPDLQTHGHAVVEPPSLHAEAEDQPRRRRIVPGRRIIAGEGRIGDVERGGRVGHLRLAGRTQALRAVVIAADL